MAGAERRCSPDRASTVEREGCWRGGGGMMARPAGWRRVAHCVRNRNWNVRRGERDGVALGARLCVRLVLRSDIARNIRAPFGGRDGHQLGNAHWMVDRAPHNGGGLGVFEPAAAVVALGAGHLRGDAEPSAVGAREGQRPEVRAIDAELRAKVKQRQ